MNRSNLIARSASAVAGPSRWTSARAVACPRCSNHHARAMTVSRRIVAGVQAPASRALHTSRIAAQADAASAGQAHDGEKRIIEILKAKFNPKQLEVADTSGGCGAFYSIVISSAAFNGLPTIKQHRLVNEELKSIIKGIHGLQLKTRAEE